MADRVCQTFTRLLLRTSWREVREIQRNHDSTEFETNGLHFDGHRPPLHDYNAKKVFSRFRNVAGVFALFILWLANFVGWQRLFARCHRRQNYALRIIVGQESGEMLSQEILHCFAKGHFAFLTCKNVPFVGHFNVLNGFAIALKNGNHLIRLR